MVGVSAMDVRGVGRGWGVERAEATIPLPNSIYGPRGACGKPPPPADNAQPPGAPGRKGSTDARTAVDDRIAWRRPAAGGAGVAVAGARPPCPHVRAARL